MVAPSAVGRHGLNEGSVVSLRDFVYYRSREVGRAGARWYQQCMGWAAEKRLSWEHQSRDWRQIPVVIISFNRLAHLRQVIGWLEQAGMQRIVVMDNASTYPPLVDYLSTVSHEVIRLHRNSGPYAFWEAGIATRFWDDYFVLTDPDVVPSEECPHDVVGRMYQIIQRYRDVRKVGIGLRIDDLPEHFAQKQKVLEWESQFWRVEVQPGLYRAAVDTTLALYRPRTLQGECECLRTGFPYVARHLPWYADSGNPTEEDLYYRSRVCPNGSWWAEGTAHSARDRLLVKR